MDPVFAAVIALAVGAVGLLASHVVRRRPTRRMAARVERRPFPPAHMSLAAHWSRATRIVETAITRSAGVRSLHDAASQQLQAADYALHTLLLELEGIMSIDMASPLTTPRPQRATVVPMRRPLAAA